MLSNFQHKFRHSHPLLQAILSCYDAELRLFKFGGQNVLFGLEDIVYMTGLNVDGDAVSGWDGDFEGVCQTYLRNEGKVGKTGCVSLAWLRKNFEDVPARALDDPEEFFCYVRAYVLFIIGCFVCPDPSGKFVSISFLRLLNTKEDFNRYAWGAALLAHLHRSLDSFFNPKTKGNLAGHSYSLMVSKGVLF